MLYLYCISINCQLQTKEVYSMIKRILILAISSLLMFALSACSFSIPTFEDDTCLAHNDTTGDGICESCGEEAPTIKAEEDFLFFDDGDVMFEVVLENNLDKSVVTKWQNLANILDDFGIKLKIKEDKKSGATDNEILVGLVESRGEKYAFDKYSLGPNGYMIKIVDDKLLITAGSLDALNLATDEFIRDFLKITEDTETIDYAYMKPIQNKTVTPDTFDITSIKIGGEDIKNSTIATDVENETYYEFAKKLQDTIYKKSGYWLPIVTLAKESSSAIVVAPREIDASPVDSFRISVAANTLYFESEYSNAFTEHAQKFVDDYIAIKSGDISFVEGSYRTLDVSIVRYSDFGAVGDGVTNDFVAIKNAHDYANISGQQVVADPDATYYISKATIDERLFYISIRTNTDWKGAKFIIDDTETTQVEMLKQCESPIIRIESDLVPYVIPKDNLPAINNKYTFGPSTKKIDLGLGYAAMLIIRNQDHKISFRYGVSYETGGDIQDEIIVVDKYGNVDKSTRLLYDFEKVTLITAYRIDMPTLTVENATFTTKASRVDSTILDPAGSGTMVAKYNTPFDRGISVERSNTTLSGIKHYVEGEFNTQEEKDGLTGANYAGFFSASYASNVTLKDCVLSGRRNYGIGESYDLQADFVNALRLVNCEQHNYYVEDENGKTVLGTSASTITKKQMYSPISNVSYCKNIEYNNSTLSNLYMIRPSFNVKIIDSTVSEIDIVGGGDFTIENSTVENNKFFNLIVDYGSSWDGTIIIKDTVLDTTTKKPSIFTMLWTNNDYGYTCVMPSIVLDNIVKTSTGTAINLIASSNGNKDQDTIATYDDIHVDGAVRTKYVENAKFHSARKTNINPLTPPEYLIVKNNAEGYVFSVNVGSTDVSTKPFFKNTVIRGFKNFPAYDPDEEDMPY